MAEELFKFVTYTGTEARAFEERRSKIITPPAGLPYRVLTATKMPTGEPIAGINPSSKAEAKANLTQDDTKDVQRLAGAMWPIGKARDLTEIRKLLSELSHPTPMSEASTWDGYALEVQKGGKESLPLEHLLRAMHLMRLAKQEPDLSDEVIHGVTEYAIVIHSTGGFRKLDDPKAPKQPDQDAAGKLQNEHVTRYKTASLAREELLEISNQILLQEPKKTKPSPKSRQSSKLSMASESIAPSADKVTPHPVSTHFETSHPLISNELRKELKSLGMDGSVNFELAEKKLSLRVKLTYRDMLSGLQLPRPERFIPPYCNTLCTVSVGGKANFYRAEQTLDRYDPEEIAHIENLLPGQYKERKTRRLDRYEESFMSSTEVESTNERDTQSTTKNEMQQSVKDVVEKESETKFGMKLSAAYGPVSLESSFGMGSTQSQSQTMESSKTIARTVTDRALERVVSRVHEERASKKLQEFEEINTHGLDNRGNTNSFVGVYRWLTKVYKARLKNYGVRMSLDCVIENPALFLREHDMAKGGSSVKKLNDFAIDGPSDVNELTYLDAVTEYGITIETPPQLHMYLSKAYADVEPPSDLVCAAHNDLAVPDGYKAVEFSVLGLWHNVGGGLGSGTVLIDNQEIWYGGFAPDYSGYQQLTSAIEKTIGVARSAWTRATTVTISVKCKRKASTYKAWQIATYNKLLEGYRKMVAEEAEAQRAESAIVAGKRNPALNREYIEREIKKAVISALCCQERFWLNCQKAEAPCGHCHEGQNISDPETHTVPMHRSDSDVCHIGRLANFFESVIDWKIMVYQLYPYYWSNVCDWPTNSGYSDDDPLFEKFLQAGMARVVVPLEAGMESAFMYFYEFGKVWGGYSAPPLLGGYEDLNTAVDVLDPKTGLPVEWEVRVPTSLVILQCGSGCVNTHDVNDEPTMPVITGGRNSSQIIGLPAPPPTPPVPPTPDDEHADEDHHG
ncbi:MAG: hypothetical protein ABL949_03585 [Fimbriimonadaceae bacterium]